MLVVVIVVVAAVVVIYSRRSFLKGMDKPDLDNLKTRLASLAPSESWEKLAPFWQESYAQICSWADTMYRLTDQLNIMLRQCEVHAQQTWSTILASLVDSRTFKTGPSRVAIAASTLLSSKFFTEIRASLEMDQVRESLPAALAVAALRSTLVGPQI